MREGDIVIVEPWEFTGDRKGDIIFKYSKTQAQYIRKKGYLSKLEVTDEF